MDKYFLECEGNIEGNAGAITIDSFSHVLTSMMRERERDGEEGGKKERAIGSSLSRKVEKEIRLDGKGPERKGEAETEGLVFLDVGCSTGRTLIAAAILSDSAFSTVSG